MLLLKFVDILLTNDLIMMFLNDLILAEIVLGRPDKTGG